jgi:isopenicillin N synthase-like dioxygenase
MNLNIFKCIHKMNKLDYYNRQKEMWDEKELSDIKNEYETKELTISQIGDIHHRTPGSISYKLKNLGIITHSTLSRGYLEYKNSSLYKEIVETGKAADAEKKKLKKETTLKSETPISNPTNEIVELRKEIAVLRKDVKEMLRLMNALYDFESQ